jgi:hypothetical protein
MHLTPTYANKTYILSQTTGGKDEPNIVSMREEYQSKLIILKDLKRSELCINEQNWYGRLSDTRS